MAYIYPTIPVDVRGSRISFNHVNQTARISYHSHRSLISQELDGTMESQDLDGSARRNGDPDPFNDESTMETVVR